ITGFPELPKQFQAYLLTKPITGEVTSIIGKYQVKSKQFSNLKSRVTIVKINKGRKDGILPGMEFEVVKPDTFNFKFNNVEIKEVDENESTGEIVQYLDLHDEVPAIGWKFSTQKY